MRRMRDFTHTCISNSLELMTSSSILLHEIRKCHLSKELISTKGLHFLAKPLGILSYFYNPILQPTLSSKNLRSLLQYLLHFLISKRKIVKLLLLQMSLKTIVARKMIGAHINRMINQCLNYLFLFFYFLRLMTYTKNKQMGML